MTAPPEHGCDLVDLGDGSYVLRTAPYLLNAGLVVGSERALLIDTGGGPRQATAILEAVRSVTCAPLVVVNTHAHLDHWFGNATLREAGAGPFLAHPDAIAAMTATYATQRDAWTATYPDAADALCDPAETPASGARVDLGGRVVEVRFLGVGHTDGDLVVLAGATLFAGDLVEQGADPDFGDSDPRAWVRTLDALAALAGESAVAQVVPGHGAVVDAAFVRAERDRLAEAIAILDAGAADVLPHGTLPYGPEPAAHLRRRVR
ncbi:glyoxylase-like metal-dependent hydrolase (beta-lactamase superfamily II) [Mumia flava]|uniref:Glyoxylase-like metal-dependent hydrolase (Beta-lactamase superfamily II) n=1 Tax=Mumia flava TaxID=1348852 RepID=A0A0B2BQI6_9ACTN|nr:MBL fold metallo-hydrolase [Mumia flava]PJJ58193.1 glyoxylase-like metal-dependent hydrolase (beta-lactamase superfamily II) [Mumia flava]